MEPATQPHTSPRKILIVEDDWALASLMERCVAELACSGSIAATGAEAVAQILRDSPDLMLLDLYLPDMNGFAVLDALAAEGRSLPFIVVTGQDAPQLIVEMMKRGARDFLLKDASLIDSLPAVIDRAFEQMDRDRRLAEAEMHIREQHQRLQAVLDSLPDPLYLIDADTCSIEMANRVAQEAGRRAFSLMLTGLGDEATGFIGSPIEEVKRSNTPLALEHVHYEDGAPASVHEVHVHPLADTLGEVRKVVEYNRDVTARKRVEQALRESEARLRQVVESLPIILVSHDAGASRQSLWTGAVREIMGYEPQQLLDDPEFILKIMDPQDVAPVRFAVRESIAAQRAFEIEFRVRHGDDDRIVWLNAQGAPICDEEGNLLRIDSILVDTTREKRAAYEREQLESRLQQTQKLESLGILAGGIAHDFNNLLTIVSGNVQFLRESLSLNPAQAKALADIDTVARNASDLTRSLQAFSGPSKPQIVNTDANAVIQEVYRFLRRLVPVRINFQFFPTPAPCVVAADAAQMQQVLINLCINARDAMRGEGRLEIRTRQITTDQLPTRLRCESDSPRYVEISVSDTGCGMDDQTLRLAFDPFFTTKPKDQATGLGLAIAYKIVRAHRGMIDVVSERGRGTDFRVYLPQAEEVSIPPPAAARIARGTERVLVIDDEEMIASLIKTVLEANGYQVVVAHRPDEALAIAEAGVEPMEMVIVDYSLPKMSGDKCLLRLREYWPNLKALLITGYQVNEADLGLDGYRILQKPFSSQSIIQAVRETLDGDTVTAPKVP